ncbi:hypothetical protein CA54_59000 [Symmachiella macrocystis]|uniref:Uncharacterized protein n=1 Tax=Symmachiella macrocystis TaxID=2527985 RepID=A0A5C6B1C7_9PLAN|nr:hypothetical protein CA54_59000 [Symmachiella macrocystis]
MFALSGLFIAGFGLVWLVKSIRLDMRGERGECIVPLLMLFLEPFLRQLVFWLYSERL